MGSGASTKAPLYTQNVDSSGNTQGGASNPSYTATSKSTTGGLSQSSFRTPTAANNNPTLVKSGATTLYAYQFGNVSTGWRYVHLFNKGSAPVPGTDSDVRVIPIPPGGMVAYQGTDIGIAFPLGLGIAISSGPGATDATTTNIAVGDVVGMIDYA